MSETAKTLDGLTSEEVDALLEQFIARGDDEMELPTFFELLAHRQTTPRTVTIKGRLEGGQLRFQPVEGVQAQGNVIAVGTTRVVVELEPAESA
jgi:hypothetical protein